MAIKTLVSEQFLPIPLAQAWDFFSSPRNLNEITPDEMVFHILSDVPDKMYPGLLIIYRLAPMLKIPMTWVTEITHIEDGRYFIDEQRQGPYALWHHEHHFKEVDGGVQMTDILHYDIGLSVLGSLAGALFVDRKVRGIFTFREQKLRTLFPGAAPAA